MKGREKKRQESGWRVIRDGDEDDSRSRGED